MEHRPLDDHEQQVLRLCKLLEEYEDKRRPVITLTATEKKAAVIQRDHAILSAKYDSQSNQFRITFSLAQFRTYVAAMARLVGFHLNVDGTVKTRDNLILDPLEECK